MKFLLWNTFSVSVLATCSLSLSKVDNEIANQNSILFDELGSYLLQLTDASQFELSAGVLADPDACMTACTDYTYFGFTQSIGCYCTSNKLQA